LEKYAAAREHVLGRQRGEDNGVEVGRPHVGPVECHLGRLGDFRFILRWKEINAPLRRNIRTVEVGNAALFVLSDLGTAVTTGETIHVDGGYDILGAMSATGASEVAGLIQYAR
jgi:enoyl-[acyl-carrier protein] reductase I